MIFTYSRKIMYLDQRESLYTRPRIIHRPLLPPGGGVVGVSSVVDEGQVVGVSSVVDEGQVVGVSSVVGEGDVVGDVVVFSVVVFASCVVDEVVGALDAGAVVVVFVVVVDAGTVDVDAGAWVVVVSAVDVVSDEAVGSGVGSSVVGLPAFHTISASEGPSSSSRDGR